VRPATIRGIGPSRPASLELDAHPAPALSMHRPDGFEMSLRE
jgi:hypothetical protein